MTVQELIDELSKVDDKSLEIYKIEPGEANECLSIESLETLEIQDFGGRCGLGKLSKFNSISKLVVGLY